MTTAEETIPVPVNLTMSPTPTKGFFLPDFLDYHLFIWGIQCWVPSWKMKHIPRTLARCAHTQALSQHIHAHSKERKKFDFCLKL